MAGKKQGENKNIANTSTPGGVVSEASSVPGKNQRWTQIAAIGIAVVLIAFGGYIAYSYVSNHKTATPTANFKEQQKKQFDNEMTKAQAAVDKIKNPQTEADRADAANKYRALGSAQMNADHPDMAVVSYNNALVVSPESSRLTYGALVYAYEASGQHDKAIETCQKYLALLSDVIAKDTQKKDVSAQQSLESYTNVLNTLQAGGQI